MASKAPGSEAPSPCRASATSLRNTDTFWVNLRAREEPNTERCISGTGEKDNHNGNFELREKEENSQTKPPGARKMQPCEVTKRVSPCAGSVTNPARRQRETFWKSAGKRMQRETFPCPGARVPPAQRHLGRVQMAPEPGLPQPRAVPPERCQSSARPGDRGTTTHLAQKELAAFPKGALLAGEGRDVRPVASHPRPNDNSACATTRISSAAAVCPHLKSLITIYHIYHSEQPKRNPQTTPKPT